MRCCGVKRYGLEILEPRRTFKRVLFALAVTMFHEGGDKRDHRVSIYARPDWSKGYGVVFHNECFGKVNDATFVAGILAEHKRGAPAVLMHCAMHSYRLPSDSGFSRAPSASTMGQVARSSSA